MMSLIIIHSLSLSFHLSNCRVEESSKSINDDIKMDTDESLKQTDNEAVVSMADYSFTTDTDTGIGIPERGELIPLMESVIQRPEALSSDNQTTLLPAMPHNYRLHHIHESPMGFSVDQLIKESIDLDDVNDHNQTSLFLAAAIPKMWSSS